MRTPTEEFVTLRMAEPLEDELRKENGFKEYQAKLWNTLLEWNGKSEIEMTKQQIEAFTCIEDALSEYTYAYGKTVYRLGYSDGIKIGVEQGITDKRTCLSLEDMSNLISLYDAVKELKITLFGTLDISPKRDSVMGVLDYVFDIINNGICTEIELLGKDKSAELITNILDKNSISPKERAKRLLDIDLTSIKKL